MSATLTQPGADMEERLRALLASMDAHQTDGLAGFAQLESEDPDYVPLLGHYAWALAAAGRHEEAIARYERVTRLNPSDSEAAWRIADRLINIGKVEEALQQYQRVLSDWPDCMDARLGVRYAKHLIGKAGKEAKPERYVVAQPQLTDRQRENAQLNQEEYEEQRLTLSSLPTDLYLASTTKCNFYCSTCSKGYEKYYAEDLQDKIFAKVKAEVLPTNTRISITGFGEPTMSSKFDEILAESLDNGSNVHFVTNASLLNYERIEKLTKLPVHITISMDGATKETFEDIRKGGNFDLVCEKLGMIKKLRDIYLSGSRSHFSFNFVALRKNISELPDVVRLAHKFRIPVVGVADYAFNSNEFDEQSLRFEPELANRMMKQASAVAKELGVELNIPPEYSLDPPPLPRSSLLAKIRATRGVFSKRERFPTRCNSPWKEPYIHPDGVVNPCCSSGQYLGDLRKSSFAEIWNGWRYRLLRLRVHSFYPPVGCRNCFVCWGINGGNAANVKAQEGLIIKTLYWFEIRLHHYFLRAAAFLARLRKSESAPEAQEPNFYMGRPLRSPAAAGAQANGASK